MIGHIKLDRKIQRWEWYQDSKMVHLFIHLLINANHKDGSWRGHSVKRGQLITGRLKLAVVLNLTEREIRTCISKLKSTGEISVKTTKLFSLITICKYETYQDSKPKSDQQNDQPIDQQSDQETTNRTSGKRPQTRMIKENKNVLDSPTYLDFVCYNVEELVLGNPAELERIMMATGKKKADEEKVKEQLHRYHLWITSNEKYPMGNKAVFAGFEGWLHRGKDFEKIENQKLKGTDPTKVQIKVGYGTK